MKRVPTVQQLRQKQFKVTVKHYRNFFRYCARSGRREQVQVSWLHRAEEYKDYFLDPRGGKTEVYFLTPEGKQFVGVAECSVHDLYCKKVGVLKALAQAYGDFCKETP